VPDVHGGLRIFKTEFDSSAGHRMTKVIPNTAGHPLRVIAVCLPFVYAKTPSGETMTIDTRRTQLVRLHRKSAKVVWKELRSTTRQQESSRGDI